MQFTKRVLGLCMFLLISTLASGVPASASALAQSETMPIERLLKPDGTLDLTTGFNGNLDFAGWQMTTDAAGVPHFYRAASGEGASDTPEAMPLSAADDMFWDAGFGDPPGGNGTSGLVRAIMVHGSAIYVGGFFTSAGNITANNIAVWNGNTWQALNFGVGGVVTAIAYRQGAALGSYSIYVGGYFDTICGNANCSTIALQVNKIARWSCNLLTCDWQMVGFGLPTEVRALTVMNGDVYVGGAFTGVCASVACATGITVNNIAKWDGSNWSALGNGVGSAVYTLQNDDTNLYVGGAFLAICGNAACNANNTRANHIAKWNGAAWLAQGFGFDGNVMALAVIGANLYAGGAFTSACLDLTCSSTKRVNYIAWWNGSGWSALNNGLNDVVYALSASGTNLYVGGDFTLVCGTSACVLNTSVVNHIAKWDGNMWSPLGSGTNNTVSAIGLSGSQVYIGGLFGIAGNKDSKYIGRWNIPAPTNLYLPLILK